MICRGYDGNGCGVVLVSRNLSLGAEFRNFAETEVKSTIQSLFQQSHMHFLYYLSKGSKSFWTSSESFIT
jgi:hypothetical protein